MTLHDSGKLVVLVVALLSAVLLRALDAIDPTTFVAIVGPVIGYVTGNGNLTRQGKPPSPVVASPDVSAALDTIAADEPPPDDVEAS